MRPPLADLSDAWLAGRARELRSDVMSAGRNEQLQITAELDTLLAEARSRGGPELIADLLRSCAMARLATSGHSSAAEPLLDELLAHTSRNGMSIQLAGAHALQGQRLILAGQRDAAVTEIARGLAEIDDLPSTGMFHDGRAAERDFVRALLNCANVLSNLGLYESAEEVSSRSHQALMQSASPHEITLHLLNFLEMMLSWGLRLQRVDDARGAREKFDIAAAVAEELETPFAGSLLRKGDAPVRDQLGLVAAAAAFHKPSGEHVARLRKAYGQPAIGQQGVLVAIALARCLAVDGNTEDAVTTLAAAHTEVVDQHTSKSVLLSLHWEEARIGAGADLPASVGAYTQALEAELWAMRESQLAALETRRKHERLSAQHGAITKQAMQDPLTGLANRRALDERLREMSAGTNAQPLSVALIDLDGFKGVNDRNSHAEGDDVLRVIASTLRDALRGDDFIGRYGGDEFVALLPGAPLKAAAAAMTRARDAVARLPGHLSRGVTLSVGLVSMAAGERPDEVLTRADAAMYESKRAGGNTITTAVQDGGDPGP